MQELSWFLPSWPPQFGNLLLFGALLVAGLVGGELAHRWVALPRVTGRRRTADQAAGFEPPEDAAEVAGVQAEIAAELGGGRRGAVREFVEDAHLGERERAVQQMLAEDADLARVEAVERADGVAAVAGARRGGHALDIVNRLVD